MAEITQNKQVPHFYCGHQNIGNNKKSKNELLKALQIVRQLVSKNIIN